MKYPLLSLLLITSLCANAQRYYPTSVQSRATASVYGGFTGFFGDLQGSSAFIDTNPHLGVSLEYALNRRFGARVYGLYYRIEANDAESDKASLRNRNLSFYSNNIEAGIMATGYILRQRLDEFTKRRRVNLYGMLGLGITTYNPKTRLEGEEYELREFSTEGVDYGRVALVVPVGGGIVVKATDRIDIAAEINYHYAFTDYLDDCSNRYLTDEQYSSELQKQLADRRETVDSGQRGSPAINDGYGTYSIRVGYKLLQYKYEADRLKKIMRKRYKKRG
jgi:hypothetical protein